MVQKSSNSSGVECSGGTSSTALNGEEKLADACCAAATAHGSLRPLTVVVGGVRGACDSMLGVYDGVRSCCPLTAIVDARSTFERYGCCESGRPGS